MPPDLLQPSLAFQTGPRKYKASFLSQKTLTEAQTLRSFIHSSIHSLLGDRPSACLLWALLGETSHWGRPWGLLSRHLPSTEPNTSAHRGVTRLPPTPQLWLWFGQFGPEPAKGLFPSLCVEGALQPSSGILGSGSASHFQFHACGTVPLKCSKQLSLYRL